MWNLQYQHQFRHPRRHGSRSHHWTNLGLVDPHTLAVFQLAVGPTDEFVEFTRGADTDNTGSGGSTTSSTIANLLEWARPGTGDSLLPKESLALRRNYRAIREKLEYMLGQYRAPDSELVGNDGESFGYETNAETQGLAMASPSTLVVTVTWQKPSCRLI